jgi:hypothetical protein
MLINVPFYIFLCFGTYVPKILSFGSYVPKPVFRAISSKWGVWVANKGA